MKGCKSLIFTLVSFLLLLPGVVLNATDAIKFNITASETAIDYSW